MIRVTVDSIRVNLLSQQRMVMLREVDNRRYLPIWIGSFEADAIGAAIQGHEPPRPMTHDLLRNIITELGGTVQHVAITKLMEQTFYAQVVIDVRGVRREIDARPSDAIALGLRVDAPLYVAEQVLEQAAITLEEEEEEEREEEDLPRTALPPVQRREEQDVPEERDVSDESLSIFRDFINSLENRPPPEEEK